MTLLSLVCNDSISTQKKRKIKLKKEEVFLSCFFNYCCIKLKFKENWSVNESFSSYHLCLKTIIICHVYFTFLPFILLLSCVFSSQIRFSKNKKKSSSLMVGAKKLSFYCMLNKGHVTVNESYGEQHTAVFVLHAKQSACYSHTLNNAQLSF